MCIFCVDFKTYKLLSIELWDCLTAGDKMGSNLHI